MEYVRNVVGQEALLTVVEASSLCPSGPDFHVWNIGFQRLSIITGHDSLVDSS